MTKNNWTKLAKQFGLSKHLGIGVLALLTLPAARAAAPDYFRLEPGSRWTYRNEAGAMFTMQVGNTGHLHMDHVHYRLTGYVAQPVMAYWNETDGNLYYLDGDTDEDSLLTSINSLPGEWYPARQRACDEYLKAQPERPEYIGPAGRFASALSIRYVAFGCADAGVEHERFAENVGMVSRTVITIAGPVTYQLVHATVGAMTISERPSTAFRVGFRAEKERLLVDLRLSDANSSALLTFPTSQLYDVILRDDHGTELWRWGADKFFEQTVTRKSTPELAFEVEVPLVINGVRLADGPYTVEGWLTTSPERQFASSTRYLHINP